MPVVIDRQHVRIEPDRARRRLAHLGARGGGEQGRGQRIELRRAHAAAQINAGDDIAPLVRAAHLQQAAVAAVKLHEIIGLQAHVVEFDEGELLVALKPHLHRIHGQHAVDREVAAHVAQEVDVVQRRQPLRIVGHDRVGAGVAEGQEFREDLLDAGLVGLDVVEGEHAAALVLAGGIAHPGGAPAHERHGLAAGLLQPAQHHDLHQRAHMEGRGRAVEADIGDQLASLGLGVDPFEVGALVDIAALHQHGEEIGFGNE